MGNILSSSKNQDTVTPPQTEDKKAKNDQEENKEAITIWPTPEDPCTYLKAPASFGDPRVYKIDNGRVPLVPHFAEYGTVSKFPDATLGTQQNLSQFVENIKTRGWYPPSVLTSQQAKWLANPKVLETLLKRFVAALHRRRVIHPVFTQSRTTHRLKIDYNAKKDNLNVQYFVADPTGGWIYDRDVPREALLSGSLWHDVEYHERHNTPEPPVAKDYD
jgi:hypothetical protein